MGVWIEIPILFSRCISDFVTPCVGVWIEMIPPQAFAKKIKSLPVWECGLKFSDVPHHQEIAAVTPCVGVWIEMSALNAAGCDPPCHSLCGSVD